MSLPSALPSGTRLQNGAYAVGSVLGQGGFAITYKGGDMAQKRYVAIKEFFPPGAVRQGAVIHPFGGASQPHAQAIADFLREAQTLARFQDPSIVRVLTSFEENNSAYMVMEMLEGQTLASRIAEKGRLDEWEVIDIGVRLSNALEIVHGAGILHRDIKPENVMLARDGRAVLIDFGTAREFDANNSGNAPAMTQIVTPGYAPLEQYAKQARRGPATDIYGLGATLYHALSGQQPTSATDRAAGVELAKLQSMVPGLTPVVADAVMKALDMDMARRPPSASFFAARLQGRRPADTSGEASDFAALGAPSFPPTLNRVGSGAGASTQASSQASGASPSEQVSFHSRLERHTAAVNALAFAPHKGELASVGSDRIVNIWNWSQDRISQFFPAHQQPITCVDYSPDGQWLATGGRDGQVLIWDSSWPRVEAKRLPLAILGDGQVVMRDLAFCPVRRELLVADEGAVTLWSAQTWQVAARREFGATSLSWSPDGALVVLGSASAGFLELLEASSLEPLGHVAHLHSELSDVAFSPDGKWIATCGADGCLRVWSAAQGELKWEQRPSPSPMSCLVWSPDSRLICCGVRETVLMWTVEGELWRRLTRHKNAVYSLAFAPNPPSPYRYVLASASRDHTINILRIQAEPAP